MQQSAAAEDEAGEGAGVAVAVDDDATVEDDQLDALGVAVRVLEGAGFADTLRGEEDQLGLFADLDGAAIGEAELWTPAARTRWEGHAPGRRARDDRRGRGRADDRRRPGLAVVVPALAGETVCRQHVAVDPVHEAGLVG